MAILLIFPIHRKCRRQRLCVDQHFAMNSSTSLVKHGSSLCLTRTQTFYDIWTKQRRTRRWWTYAQMHEDNRDAFGLHQMYPNQRRARQNRRVEICLLEPRFWRVWSSVNDRGFKIFPMKRRESRFLITSRICSKSPQRSTDDAKETRRAETQVEKE